MESLKESERSKKKKAKIKLKLKQGINKIKKEKLRTKSNTKIIYKI